jgi:hypothetical protein
VKCSKKPGTVRANYCTVMDEGVLGVAGDKVASGNCSIRKTGQGNACCIDSEGIDISRYSPDSTKLARLDWAGGTLVVERGRERDEGGRGTWKPGLLGWQTYEYLPN